MGSCNFATPSPETGLPACGPAPDILRYRSEPFYGRIEPATGRPGLTKGYIKPRRNGVKERVRVKLLAVTTLAVSGLLFGSVIAEASGRKHATSGIASHYSHAGRKTANGETANPRGMTAAHRSLPFGTRVRVTNRRNGRSVVVRINDRGPFVRGRVIDLTTNAARAIGFTGLAPVSLQIIR
jgi:rare lipoprotein A